MIKATAADQPAIEAFLKAHIATSMFQLSNLRRHGMDGGHPRAMTFWLGWKDGQITDVLGMSEEGFVFPQCPNGPWGDAAVLLAGRGIRAIMGDEAQVMALRAALGLDPDAKALVMSDPLFTLPLTDLIMPDVTDYQLSPITDAYRDIAIGWRSAYLIEVMPLPGEEPDEKAMADIEAYMEGDSHRILLHHGEPVAMTGFNADMPESVQIGGVYTPPDHRCKGLARRAVALHLAEARGKGVQQAILFAASDTAAKAYRAVGFRKVGVFGGIFYEAPQVAHV